MKPFVTLRIEALEAELAAGVESFEAEDIRVLISTVRALLLMAAKMTCMVGVYRAKTRAVPVEIDEAAGVVSAVRSARRRDDE